MSPLVYIVTKTGVMRIIELIEQVLYLGQLKI